MRFAPPRGLIVVGLVTGAAGYACYRAYADNAHLVFYISLIVIALGLWMLVRSSRLASLPGLLLITRTLVIFAVVLPAADRIFLSSRANELPPAVAAPVYSFEIAKGNPEAFRAWWAYYVNEWTRPDGSKSATEMPDPQGILPFVERPNSTGRFFESLIRINNLGFRGPDIDPDKAARFRVFVLGESPTFGTTIHQDDRPWPEVLQTLVDARLSCDRSIEVINAGTEAYNLEDNLERVRRDIIPLKPDLVISYHGINGWRFMGSAAAPAHKKGPSALIDEAVVRLSQFQSRRKPPVISQLSDADLESQYAQLYRKLIRLGRENSFRVGLANASMVITQASSPEVIDFYGRTFHQIDEILAAISVHNQMVERLANEAGIPFIDTTPHLAGVWNQDLFLDLMHFTQKGNERLAANVLDGIAPLLRGDPTLNCRDR